MPSQWWDDDEQLLAALGEALRIGPVPHELIEAGKRAFRAYGLDAQVAALVYDSALEREPALAGLRAEAEPAALRALRFTGGALTIELEVAEDAIFGQLLPPQPGVVRVQSSSGEDLVVPVDDAGGFAIRPLPTAPFRLRCHTAGGTGVVTDQILLDL
jgi:hypothetical protein